MPSSKTCVCSLRNPRVNTDVNWPAIPVCTTESPGTSRKASLTRWICFCSNSSERLRSRLQAIDPVEYRNASLRRRLTPLPLQLAKESATVPVAKQTTGTKREQRGESDWGAHAARVHFPVARRKACVWRAAKHHRPAACAPRNFDAARCEHNKFPPTPRVGLVRRRMFSKRRIAQLSFFFLRRSFFALSRSDGFPAVTRQTDGCPSRRSL